MSAHGRTRKTGTHEKRVTVAEQIAQRNLEALTADETEELFEALQAVRVGDFTVRLPTNREGRSAKIADAFNQVVSANHRMAQQLDRIAELEQRAAQRTTDLAAANSRLLQSERGRSLALAAGNM